MIQIICFFYLDVLLNKTQQNQRDYMQDFSTKTESIL